MKTNIQKGKKVASAMLAGVLAMGMCVPAVSFSAFTSPEVAVAVEGDSTAGTKVVEAARSAEMVEMLNQRFTEYKNNFEGVLWSEETEAQVNDYVSDSMGLFFLDCLKAAGAVDALRTDPVMPTEIASLLVPTTTPSAGDILILSYKSEPSVLNPYVLSATPSSSEIPVIAPYSDGATWNTSLEGVTTLQPDESSGFKVYDEVLSVDENDENAVYSYYTYRQPTTLALKTPGASARMTSDATLVPGTSYTAIKVFDADITGKYGDENAPKGTNIQFANGVNADVIKAAGDPDFAEGVDAAHQDLSNAQNAAEYLNANIAHQPGVGLTADSYGISLAKRLMAAGADTKTIVADGDKVQLDGEGYYLIVRTSDLTGENTAATSPIFAALDEGDTEITLKVAIPTITKQIQEDGDNSAVDDTDVWGDEADHTLNQDVNYRLIGTIADNVDAFATYEYNFKDSWDATKLALHADSVKVVVKTADTTNEAGETVPGTETDITDAVKAGIKTDTNGELQVNIADLKAVYPTLTATDQVIVSYTAEQCAATATPEGIVNTAFLEYSNNPVFASKGMTPEVSVKDYSYALRIHKVDNSTKEDLAGVEFSIKNSAGKFLALVDGEVVEQDAEYAWTTDAQGRIMIDGVDADTYTVAETKALDAYDELGKDITMTINAADRDAVVGSISSESALVGEDADAADKNEVVSQVLVNNVKQIPLPSTGELGLGLVIFLAVAAGIYAVSRRRKQEETRTLVI